MSGQLGMQNQSKRTNKTLSRLHLIRKNIMDSLGVLSKQNRSPEYVQRSNTMPKNHGHDGSTKLKQSDFYKTSTWVPESRKKCLRTDFIRKANDFRENQEVTSLLLNHDIASETANQTWSCDTVSALPAGDSCSNSPGAGSAGDPPARCAPEKGGYIAPVFNIQRHDSRQEFERDVPVNSAPETSSYITSSINLQEPAVRSDLESDPSVRCTSETSSYISPSSHQQGSSLRQDLDKSPVNGTSEANNSITSSLSVQEPALRSELDRELPVKGMPGENINTMPSLYPQGTTLRSDLDRDPPVRCTIETASYTMPIRHVQGQSLRQDLDIDPQIKGEPETDSYTKPVLYPQETALRQELERSPPLRYVPETSSYITPSLSKRGPALRRELDVDVYSADQSKMSENLYKKVKHQEVQTDPEPLEPESMANVNDDIIRYLNQFHDTTVPNIHACNQLQYPGTFSPSYDLYEDRHCTRYHGQTDFFFKTREGQHRQEEYASYYGRSFHSCEKTHPTYPATTYTQIGRHRNTDRFQYETVDWSFGNECNFLTPPFPDTRISSDGSLSVFSSETDSDFMFYPCTSLAQTFQNMSMVEPRDPSYLSPPTDMPENINMNFSWKSDFCGSSLDDITVQFFLDEDALSDDVFLDDLEDNCRWKISDASRKGTKGDKDAFVGHVLDESSPLMMRDTLGLTNSISEEYYTYRYADIDEVLQHCSDYSPNNFQPNHSLLNKQYINESTSRKVSSGKSTSSDNSPKRNDESSPSARNDFSYVFDSLRRNSTQTKARNMWRQRRAKGKKGNKINTTVGLGVTGSTGRQKSPQNPQQNLVFTFDQVNVPSYSRNLKPPPKPLRGILKNKDRKPILKQEAGQSHDINKPIQNVSPCRIRISNSGNVGDVDSTQRVDGDIKSYTSSHAADVVPKEVTSSKVTTSMSDPPLLPLTSTDQETPAIHLNTRQKDDGPCITEKTSIIHQDHTDADLMQTSRNSESCHDVDMSNPQSTENTADQFHFLISPSNNGTGEVISVRKNSLEIYKWTLSLQRRRRRQTKKQGACAKPCNRGSKNGDCLSENHMPNSRITPATL